MASLIGQQNIKLYRDWESYSHKGKSYRLHVFEQNLTIKRKEQKSGKCPEWHNCMKFFHTCDISSGQAQTQGILDLDCIREL